MGLREIIFRPSVFKDESKLDIHYVPPRLPHREEQLKQLLALFSSVLINPGSKACRAVLLGSTGTGKTAVALKLGEVMAEEARRIKVNLRYVYLNTRVLKDGREVLNSVLTALIPSFPRRGLSYVDMLKALWHCLEQGDLQLILTLDEAHYLMARQVKDVVYDLSRIHEQFRGAKRLHLILISRDESFLESLDKASQSTFKASIVRFNKYGMEELYDIVSERVEEAFQPNAVSREVIRMIADLASPWGDARYALELAWRAGKYADVEGLDQVLLEHVRKAKAEIHPEIRREELYALSLHQRLLLLAVARYFKRVEQAYASFEALMKDYRLICEEYEVKPSDEVVEDLYALHSQGLIVIKEGQVGLLDAPASMLEQALVELLNTGRLRWPA
ncbi:MAG: hypothetical protein DRJ98_00050 [Thermoprotei archaeon]|nr:MAG: hypothetical protein DRJ98_00050 [Thermoprotei archaeon]RLF18452.1 MAG: hypothetical protein DRN06_01510 [Thermoprotei archaeon]